MLDNNSIFGTLVNRCTIKVACNIFCQHISLLHTNVVLAFLQCCQNSICISFCLCSYTCKFCDRSIMPYYGLFWMRSPYLDLQWRSRSTGNIPGLLITSIVWHKNKNRWVGDPLWRSCSLFCVVRLRHGSSLRTREISLHKTIHMISTGDPPLTCSCYTIWTYLSNIDILLLCYTHICGSITHDAQKSSIHHFLLYSPPVCLSNVVDKLFTL